MAIPLPTCFVESFLFDTKCTITCYYQLEIFVSTINEGDFRYSGFVFKSNYSSRIKHIYSTDVSYCLFNYKKAFIFVFLHKAFLRSRLLIQVDRPLSGTYVSGNIQPDCRWFRSEVRPQTSNTVQKTLAGSIQTRTETYYTGNAKWNNRAFQTARPSPVFVGFDYIICMFYILYISIYKNLFLTATAITIVVYIIILREYHFYPMKFGGV